MQEIQNDLKTSTVAKKYVKNHAGAKILAAGYTKGNEWLITIKFSFISTIVLIH